MRRAAIYARFSTELQSDRSVDDQIDLCADFARRQGYSIAGQYADRARSGTTTHGRDGLSSLLHDAKRGAFDAVIVEALDRLSRDQEDLAGIHKRLSFMGIEIIAVHDGRADALQVGIRGLVSSLWIADLKHKIRRGMSGRVRDGKTAGGRAYGYRPTREAGRPEVYEPEAAVVRRIYAEYLAGKTPREIAGGLNADGIDGPRGAKWSAATINGNTKRGHGIIQNPIYGGRLIWNRVRMVRDPDTGRRVSRPNPSSEWQEAPAPELAIVDPQTWAQAQNRKATRAGAGPRPEPYRVRKSILSGLLRCGRCGGGMSAHDARGGVRRVRCTTRGESGSCDNSRRYRLDRIEAAVIDGMAARLADESGITAYVANFQNERIAESKARAALERDAAAVRGKIERMARMLVDGRVPESFFDTEMPAARAELAALEARLAAAPAPNVVALHPAALAAYRRAFADLGGLLRGLDPSRDAELIAAFRDLIDKVVIRDMPDGAVDCEIIGCLGPLLTTDQPQRGAKAVAEVRFPSPPPMIWGAFRTKIGKQSKQGLQGVGFNPIVGAWGSTAHD